MTKKIWVVSGFATLLLVAGGGAAFYVRGQKDDSGVHGTSPGSLALSAGVGGEQSKTVPISNDTPKRWG